MTGVGAPQQRVSNNRLITFIAMGVLLRGFDAQDVAKDLHDERAALVAANVEIARLNGLVETLTGQAQKARCAQENDFGWSIDHGG